MTDWMFLTVLCYNHRFVILRLSLLFIAKFDINFLDEAVEKIVFFLLFLSDLIMLHLSTANKTFFS